MDIANTTFGAITGTVEDVKTIAYGVCYLPMFIGATLFLFNSVRKTTGTTLYGNSEEFVTAGVD